jgi:hypothetical protein
VAHIVFLNMADDLHVDGHKAVEALRSKHPAEKSGLFGKAKEKVMEVELVPLYRAWKSSGPHDKKQLASVTKDLGDVRRDVATATKVMISVHGPLDAVDHAIIRNPQGGGEKVNYKELGRFLLELLAPAVCHNLTLVTCFAARSSDYGADHQQLDKIDWTDSFAYKVFNEICQQREVRMTARTGELSFNSVSGASEVQTELAIEGTIDNKTIQAETSVGNSQMWWQAHVGRLSAKGSKHGDFAIALTIANNNTKPAEKLKALQDLRAKPGLPSTPEHKDDNTKCLDYLDALIRLTEASARQADPVKGKYGKLVYRYVHGRGICIFAKYPTPVMVHPALHAVDPSLLRQFAKKAKH